jgi:hypothetical protein
VRTQFGGCLRFMPKHVSKIFGCGELVTALGNSQK